MRKRLAIYREHTGRSDLDLAKALRGFALLKEAAGEVEPARFLWLEARSLYEAAHVQGGVQESDAHLELPLCGGR